MISKAWKNVMVTYLSTALAGSSFSSYDKYWPNTTLPDIETLTSPIILVDLDDVTNRQFTLGSRSARKTGFITVTLLVKEGSGINLISEFKEFMDTIGLRVQSGVTYKEPRVLASPAKFKGWEPTCVGLPYQIDNYV